MEPASETRPAGGPRRSALVTGASSGIGRAFAERLARDEYDLVLVARSRERLEELATRLKGDGRISVDVVPADLTNSQDLRSVEERIAKDRTLDLLVNNAGFGTQGRFAELPVDREEEEIRLNVLAVVRLTRAGLATMVERGRGGIINVSSLAAIGPMPYFATYGATKAFLKNFTEAIAEELKDSGVRLQVLCPGFTRTEFQDRAGVDASRIPDFAWQSAEEVVEASLGQLGRGGVVCIPGAGNRALAAVTGALPRKLAGRIAGSIGKMGL